MEAANERKTTEEIVIVQNRAFELESTIKVAASDCFYGRGSETKQNERLSKSRQLRAIYSTLFRCKYTAALFQTRRKTHKMRSPLHDGLTLSGGFCSLAWTLL